MSQLIKELVQKSSSWPFELAKKVVKRIGSTTPDKGYVLFEAGYGPSGLPHIGTYGEMIRTKMVQNAFKQISDIPTKFFIISDDIKIEHDTNEIKFGDRIRFVFDIKKLSPLRIRNKWHDY